MPSLIAHTATGVALVEVLPGTERLGGRARRALIAAALTMAPDLDFVPQLLTGRRYHHGFSHSLLFTLGVALLAALVAGWLRPGSGRAIGLLTLLLYGSHLVLDALSVGGPGIEVLWPFWDEPWKLPITFFPPVHYSRGLLDPSHLIFLGFESAYAGLVLGLVWWVRRRGGAGLASAGSQQGR